MLVPFVVKTNVPFEAPEAVGLYAMETVQVAPAARGEAQVVADLAKGADGVWALIVSAPVPVFLTVMTLTAEVVPTLTVPKASEDGESETV